MRKVFTDNLPKIETGVNKGKTDWGNSIGQYVPFIYDDINGEIKIISYGEPKGYITLSYNGNVTKIKANSLITRCAIGNLIGASNNHSGHRIKIGTIFKDEKRNIKITAQLYQENKYNSNIKNKVYSYVCLDCGWDKGIAYESNLLRGYGCGCCAGKIIVEGINDIPTTAPWMIEYFQGGYDEAKLYTRGSDKRIYFICPCCGRVKNKNQSIYVLHKEKSIGCTCGDGISFPEKFMCSVLQQLTEEYIYQYQPDWSNKRSYDFYLPNKNLILEIDGGLGHGRNIHALSKMTAEETKAIDSWKDEQAILHGMNVIRIDALKSEKDYLKQNICKKLSAFYALNLIDWNLATEYATKNLVKEISLFYEENPSVLIKDIAKKFGVCSDTVRTYLKRGGELSWCSYTIELSKQKNAQRLGKLGKSRERKISVYVDKTLIKTYDSITSCLKNSELDLQTKISKSGIHKALNSNTSYQGFEFKYVS